MDVLTYSLVSKISTTPVSQFLGRFKDLHRCYSRDRQPQIAVNLEEVYMTLYGASNRYYSGSGVEYEVIKLWFTRCAIIDGRILTEELFVRSIERLCPNREALSQAQFIQLLAILGRETRQDLEVFVEKFQRVQPEIVDQVVESRRNDDYTLS